MSAFVRVSLDLPVDVEGTLFAEEFEVLQEAGEESVQLASDIWTGWKYAGKYPASQKGTSNASWSFVTMQPGEDGFTNGIQIENLAEVQPRPGSYEVVAWGRKTGRRKPYANNQVGSYYAAYVTRSGSTRPEWHVVFDRIKAQILPDTERRLRDRILENIGRKRRQESFEADMAGAPTHFFEVL